MSYWIIGIIGIVIFFALNGLRIWLFAKDPEGKYKKKFHIKHIKIRRKEKEK